MTSQPRPWAAMVGVSLLVAGLVAAPLAASAQLAAGAPPSAGDAPATFKTPDGWRLTVTGPVSELSPPEANFAVKIIAVGPAPDPRAAVEAAWRLAGEAPGHAVKLVTSLPGRNGWDEASVISYETSAGEHLVLQALARRKGADWTVVLVKGDEGTAEKRGGPLGVALASLRPAGYVKENFADETAHRMTPERVRALLDFVRTASDELHVPGVGIALIEDGKVLYEGGVGVRELGKPEPIDAHTRFIIASNTKGMTTLLLARAVDAGLLSWDEPVTKAYPPFRLGSDATTRSVLIRNLVCACTGLPRKDYEVLFTNTAKTPAASTFAFLAGTEPTSKFGEVFQYNNLMASAAGYVAGLAFYPNLEMGAAYDKAMQTQIFDPLAMKDTTLDMDVALGHDHASPHGEDPDGHVKVLAEDLNRTFTPSRPAGGAWSSPHDMILYVQDELTKGVLPNGKRLVSEKNLLIRRARGVPISEDAWYGMGLMEDATWGVSVIHHGGDLAGFHSDIIAIPSANVGAVILTNADNGALMRRPFMRRLLEILYDGRPEAAADVAAAADREEAQRKAERARLVIPAAPQETADLAPLYRNPALGQLKIERHGPVLTLVGTAWTSELATRRNDDASVSLVTIDPQVEGVEFVIGKDGAKRTLTTRDGQHTYVFTEAS